MNIPGVRAGVKTALLDIDGTLIDSNDAHARAWVDALGEGGFAVPFERVRPLIGMGADQLLPALGVGLTSGTNPGKAIVARRGEIFKSQYLPTLKPTRGARELLVALRDANVACVVATSAQEDELDALLAIGGLSDLIQTKSTASDASSSKPAPDIIHAALQRSGSMAGESVMLGDTVYDITAAMRAGVPTIALRCGGSPDADLAKAVVIYDDPAALSAAIRR
jgi:phosphoglycolate phosphatase-like HAD superfamily hydrolase